MGTPSDLSLKSSYIWESFCKYVSRWNMLPLTHLPALLFSPRNDGSPRFWQRSGERCGIKAVRGCSPKPECKALGVLRSGRSQSAKLLVVLSCVNIHSDVSSKHGTSLGNAEALEEEALRASTHLLGQDSDSAIMVIFLTTYSRVFSLSYDDLTPILTTHNHSSSWGKSQQSNDGKVLCSGLLVESVGADRQDHLRTGAFKIKQDTLGV